MLRRERPAGLCQPARSRPGARASGSAAAAQPTRPGLAPGHHPAASAAPALGLGPRGDADGAPPDVRRLRPDLRNRFPRGGSDGRRGSPTKGRLQHQRRQFSAVEPAALPRPGLGEWPWVRGPARAEGTSSALASFSTLLQGQKRALPRYLRADKGNRQSSS